MDIELISKIKEAITTKNKEEVKRLLKDFDKVYDSEQITIPTNYEEYTEVDQTRRRIIVEIHTALEEDYELFENIDIKYINYNLGLMEYIAFNNVQYLFYKYEIYIEKLVMGEAEKIEFEENLISCLYELVEGYFYKGMNNLYDKKLVTLDFCNYVEDKLEKFFKVLDGIFLKGIISTDDKKDFMINEKVEEKFIGNPLSKRKGNKFEIYMKVSQTIKIIDTEFSNISGVQKLACEMYGIEPTSYSKWKNDRKENQLLVDSWNKKISEDEKENIRVKINKELKK